MGKEYDEVMKLLLTVPGVKEHLESDEVSKLKKNAKLTSKLLAIYRYDFSIDDADMEKIASTINKIYENYSGRIYTVGIDSTEKGYDYKALIFTREKVTEEESVEIFKTYIDSVCYLNETEDLE